MSDLPSEPSLQQLRHQARDLQRAVRRGDQDALAEVAQRHPAGRPDDAAVAGFPLSAAQLVVARRYDFPSWARLRRYVEVVERYSRFPERMASAGPTSPADEFLRLACLRYEDDQPGRWAQAHQILLANPEITQVSVYAAAAAADVPRLAAHLSGDPGAANRQGGPFRWEPLFYLAYARHDPAIGETAVLTAARMLLAGRRGPERRLPMARPADSVHRADRRLRRGRARPGPPAAPSALAGPGPAAARSRRRPQRRPGAVQPDVRAGPRSPGAAVRVRPRRRRRRSVEGPDGGRPGHAGADGARPAPLGRSPTA